MTYNVFGGTLNLAQSIQLLAYTKERHNIQDQFRKFRCDRNQILQLFVIFLDTWQMYI